jgi:hypothetical protein
MFFKKTYIVYILLALIAIHAVKGEETDQQSGTDSTDESFIENIDSEELEVNFNVDEDNENTE